MIGRLLARLATGRVLDVIVVANGCSDGIAGIVGAFGPGCRTDDVLLPHISSYRFAK